MSADPNCIFCKIVAGQIPARKAHEDDELLVFHDIAPWAPVHVLAGGRIGDPDGRQSHDRAARHSRPDR